MIKVTTARIYRMTVSSHFYDKPGGCAREMEMHFKASRRGRIGDVRRCLAKRGTKIFKNFVRNETGTTPPDDKIRIGFEREMPTSKAENRIAIESRGMRYVGRDYKADRFPSKTLQYSKKRPKILSLNEIIRKKINTIKSKVIRNVKKWFKRLLR